MKRMMNGAKGGMQFFRTGPRNQPGWQTWPTFPGFGNMGYRYSAPIQHVAPSMAQDSGMFVITQNGTHQVLAPPEPVVMVAPSEVTRGTPVVPEAHVRTPDVEHPYDEPSNGENGGLLPLLPGTAAGGGAPAGEEPGSTMEANGEVPGDMTYIAPDEMGMAEEKKSNWPIYVAVGAGVLVIGGIAAAFIWGGK